MKQTKKILLIEDDKVLADIYAEQLNKKGYEASVAYDGESALPLVTKIIPDLIITGILMPKISGFDVLDVLKNTVETKHIPVLVLSAMHQPRDIEKARELGAVDYLVKSRDPIKDTLDVIAKVLEGDYEKFQWSDSFTNMLSQ